MMIGKILHVEDLTYRHLTKRGLFASKQEFFLGPINLVIEQGKTVAIVGDNGSGKTLLGKLLSGAIKPTSGNIEFLGDLNHHEKKQNCHPVRLILQHNRDSMSPVLTIGEIMHNSLKLNGYFDQELRREKIENTLLKVGMLRDHYYFYRHMLSDGQQQRFALARALLLDPSIIVADEPFAALDPSVRSQTINLLLDLQKELGLGFVFISHNLGIVRHISDSIIVMDKGKIVEQDDTSSVFDNPKHKITKNLLDAHFQLLNRHKTAAIQN